MLHVVIFCKSVASQVLFKGSDKVAVTGPGTANRTSDLLGRHCWKVIDHPPCSPALAPNDRHPFGFPKKDLAGNRLAPDADTKKAVTP